MGPSGSGKSTLLYILGVLDTPSSGTLTIDGKDPFALGDREQAAFATGRSGSSSRITRCCRSARCSRTCSRRRWWQALPGRHGDDQARAREILAQVGLGDRLDHRPAELSGGEKQRAAIARALILDPLVVLCDEPTGNLDRATADTVASLLLDLHTERNTTLVVVTHSAALAERFPVRYEMNNGNLERCAVND